MKRRQNSGRMFVIRQWKKFVLQMGIGLCLCSAKPIDGFAAPPMDDGFQRVGQREDMPNILPDARKNTEWGMEPDANGWEEEFTDTDSRRGILAVRGEVFQGFGGQVLLVVREMEGSRKTVISMTGEGGYIANQELRPGTYQVVSVEADSDGRKFDCHVEAEELVVDRDRVTMCRFFINPGSVYQVTYETEGEIQRMENRDKEVGTEPALGTAEGQVNKQGERERNLTEGYSVLEEQSGIPIAFVAAVFGTVISLYSVVRIIRRHQN